MKKPIVLLILSLALSACKNMQQKKELSLSEMNQYQLTGQVSDAEICPTELDDKGNSRVVGPCSKVNCHYVEASLKCETESLESSANKTK